MINWRNGKAGFVGASKYIIKGLFQYAHSVTSESAVTPDSFFSVIGLINTAGQNVEGKIVDVALSVSGIITEITSVSGLIIEEPLNVLGKIDADGISVKGDI